MSEPGLTGGVEIIEILYPKLRGTNVNKIRNDRTHFFISKEKVGSIVSNLVG